MDLLNILVLKLLAIIYCSWKMTCLMLMSPKIQAKGSEKFVLIILSAGFKEDVEAKHLSLGIH